MATCTVAGVARTTPSAGCTAAGPGRMGCQTAKDGTHNKASVSSWTGECTTSVLSRKGYEQRCIHTPPLRAKAHTQDAVHAHSC